MKHHFIICFLGNLIADPVFKASNITIQVSLPTKESLITPLYPL